MIRRLAPALAERRHAQRRLRLPPWRRGSGILAPVLFALLGTSAAVPPGIAAAEPATSRHLAAGPPRTSVAEATPAASTAMQRPRTPPPASADGRARNTVPAPLVAPLGVRFDAVLPSHVRGGALPSSIPALPTALGNPVIETRNGVRPAWVAIRPPTLPMMLHRHRPSPSYGALVDGTGRPVRVLAEAQSTDCSSLFDSLAKRLAERYGESVAGNPAHAAGRNALFVSARHHVQLLCGDGKLVLDYIDGRGYERWLAEHRAKVAQFDRRERLSLATRVAPSAQGRLTSAFGVPFDQPADLPGVMPDIDAAIRPPAPFTAWPNAQYQLMVDPDGLPIRIAASADFVSPAAAAAERKRLSAALIERYGQPRRERPLHVVITRGNRHIVVAQEGSRLSLVFLENVRLQTQRSRLQARQAELADALARQRDAERAGL